MTRDVQNKIRMTKEEHALIEHAAAEFGWNRSAMMRYATLRYLADHYIGRAELAEQKGNIEAAREAVELAKLYDEEAKKRRDLGAWAKRAKGESAKWELRRVETK